jgi:alpha-D-xyloside xylohydrolase
VVKFTNGCWLFREGVKAFSPAQAYRVEYDNKQVVIYAPTQWINHRGDTLGGVNLTVRITSPAPDIFRIRADHYLGVKKRTPNFLPDNDNAVDIKVADEGEALIVISGNLRLAVNKASWRMDFYNDKEKLTSSNQGGLAYIKTGWKGLAYDDKDKSNAYMREQLSLSVGEYIYGLGERFTPFIKNGQSVDIWNEDGGTSTEQAYKNVPFYISNKGYGVFVNNPGKVSFEIGSELVKKVQFSVVGESLDYYIINGPSMKDVISRYTLLTGRPSLPPAWSFGLWLSTSFTTDYDEETVIRFVDGMAERGIPLKVFHFDCFWMREFCWTDMTWNPDIFPDPAGMLKRLKEKGLKVCVWINSYIAQESSMFKEGAERGYFIKRPNGDIWQWDMWQPGMAIVDFTNPEACAWYASKLEALMDMGVDCFKTDFGERIPVDVVYHDGSDPEKMHNYYSYLYNKLVFETIEKKRGRDEAVVFARSATAGGQKFPVHWGGDCWSDYESMAESLRGGLSLTMSGFGYWSHDIGGFESTSTPDVYKRWVAFGLLSTHSRLHGSTSYRVPWAYDEEAVEVLRFFTGLKASLMPYLYACAVNNSQTGIPVMRSMVMEFKEDPVCHFLDRQYMLGDALLVAPIFNEEGIASYYLPEGNWTDFLTGEVKKGKTFITGKHGYLSIPLLVREGSLIAIGKTSDDAVYDYADRVTFAAYELKEEIPATAKVYGPDGVLEAEAEAIRTGSTIRINVKSEKPWSVKLVNITGVSADEAVASVSGKDTVIESAGTQELVCRLKE